MSKNTKRPKTAVLDFVQTLEKMQVESNVASKELKQNLKSETNNFSNVDLKEPKNRDIVSRPPAPRRALLSTPNEGEVFSLPSGKTCKFIPKTINANKCCVWGGNARDQERLDQEVLNDLKSSIKAQGQLVPALARPSKLIDKTYTHEIIYGSRRLKACQELGVEIRILEADISDEDALFFMDAENASREDLSLYEKAKIYDKWIKDGIFSSQVDLAKNLGLSRRWVNILVGYLKIPQSIISALPSLRDLTKLKAEKILAYISKYPNSEQQIEQIIDKFRKTKEIYTSDEFFNFLFKHLAEKNSSDIREPNWETKDIIAEDGERVLTIKTSKTGKINLDLSRNLTPQKLSKFLDGLEKLAKKL